MWGEALMQEDRSDLAQPKFQSAAQYAPNWGRLHLKWGEALVYAGHPAEAQTQLVIASTLYLSPRDRLALGRYLR
jgi:Tfp pilus assembly protein PilF